MTTATKSQAARLVEHLNAADGLALDAWCCLNDSTEILNDPDGEPLSIDGALALVGQLTIVRRNLEQALEAVPSLERQLADQVWLARE